MYFFAVINLVDVFQKNKNKKTIHKNTLKTNEDEKKEHRGVELEFGLQISLSFLSD